jgi:hypothetical protein
MGKKSNYEALYRRNIETGRIIIDVSLEDYYEFFHEWDNSAFKKRDIHPELAEFLDLCSEDIPLRKKLQIVFSLSATKTSKEKEEQIRTSYLNYYNSLYRLETRKTKKIVRVSVVLLLISLAFIRYCVKCGMDFNPALTKLGSHVIWEFHIGTVNIRDFFNDRFKFVHFFIHILI